MDLTPKCPVCGSLQPSSMCDRCGYTRLIFPKERPDQLNAFEQKRIRIMRKVYCCKQRSRACKPDDTARFQVCGTLLIRNLMTDSVYAFPIHEGRNIYGALEINDEKVHYVDPLRLGIDIPGRMFEINASKECLKLVPIMGFRLSSNRLYVTEEIEIDEDDFFFYSNLLGFNAVIFK